MLNHPNLITVHDCGLLEERHPYFVMDLVDGITLSDKIKKEGPLQVEEALPLFIQVCFGLAYTHDLGIIHRDIKPSNIILVRPHQGSTSYNVKIVDFGIAKLATHETTDTQGLTKTGEIFGSPLYMSPEQCLGVGVDSRSDIYSVGCVLFEALAGLPPFLGNTALSTMMKHQSDRPPTLKEATLGKEFPQALEQIVAKLLEKEPGKRYQTLKAVAHDLSLLQQGISSPTLEVESRLPAATSGRTMAVFETVMFCLLSAAVSAGIVGFFMDFNYKKSRMEEQAAAAKVAAQDELAGILPKLAPYADTVINDKSLITTIRSDRYGATYRHFRFGKRMGHIKWSSIPGPIIARGEIDVPIKDEVRLTIEDPAVVQNPHIFSRFSREDLDEVCLSRNTGVSDATFTDIGCLKKLRVVELAHCLVSDKVIDRLNELPDLRMVDLSKTQVTMAGVKRLKRLRFLQAFFVETFKGASQIVELVKGSPYMINLTIEKADLKDDDLSLIKTLPNLNTLYIDCNPAVTDKGFAHLRGSKSIVQLNVAKTGITSKAIDTVLAMPALRFITIEKGTWNQAELAQLKLERPKLKVTEIDYQGQNWQTRVSRELIDVIETDKKAGKSNGRMLDLR